MRIGLLIIIIFARNNSKTLIFNIKIRRFVAPLYLHYIYIYLNPRYFSPKNKEFNNIKTIRIELLIIIIFVKNNSKTLIFEAKSRLSLIIFYLKKINNLKKTLKKRVKKDDLNAYLLKRFDIIVIF